MNCQEVAMFVSALYDGENVPRTAAEHIFTCERCRSQLKTYSEVGVELRLAASQQEEPVRTPAALLARARTRGACPEAFLWQRIPVPHYVVLTMLCLLAISIAAIPLVRAQTKPRWFLFGLTANEHRTPLFWIPSTDGYHDQQILTYAGPQNAIVVRIAVKHVAEHGVSLWVRARRYADFQDIPAEPLAWEGAVEVTYAPRQIIDIPVEGGGTVHLLGRIEDHQPQIAWGEPMELDENQFIVRSPVLVSNHTWIGELQGATAVAAADHECVQLRAGPSGRFLFALHPFSGAVEGKVNWGELIFTWEGIPYRLVSPAPISGGEQPRRAWIRRDLVSEGPAYALGTLPLPE